MLGEEVGQEECAELFLVHRGELLGAAEELVAVRAGKTGCFGMSFEQGIERAARPAVGIRDEHVATLRHGLIEQRLELGNDALGPVVQVGRQICDLDRVGETLCRQDGAQLRGECTAGDDEGRDGHAMVRKFRPPTGREARPSTGRGVH